MTAYNHALSCGIILLIIGAAAVTSFTCTDGSTCMEVHLRNPVLLNLLNNRCKFDQAAESQRRITFLHLPKTGGSSVRDFLKVYGRWRTRKMVHEHFVVAALEEPNNLFATMLREPVSRAISFYAYVNSLASGISKEAKANALWAATYKVPPVQWSADAFIQRTLFQDPLGFFLRDVTNITESITRFNYTKIQALPHVSLRDTIPGTLQSFVNYTSTMLTQYRCSQHLEVAFILLTHFEVVGTLERTSDFYTVLFKRGDLKSGHKQANAVHSNPTQYNLTAEEKATMKANLREPLYCAEVLWRIAGLISETDVACVS